MIHNDAFSPIFGVGPGVELPSFIFKHKMRDDNVGYNAEAGFRCALSALEKRLEYRAIPHYHMTVNGVPLHFVGEKNHKCSEVIVEGDLNSDKFIVWYIWGEEVIGFLTVGYQNLHLYLWEAMKLLIMPPAMHLRSQVADHKAIVAKVLKCRPEINAKRKEILRIPSVKITEFERERERLETFRSKLRANVDDEKRRQRQKMAKLKEKYDKEGVQVIDDVSQIGDQNLTDGQRRKLMQQQQRQAEDEAYQRAREEGIATKPLTRTRSGRGFKPGGGPATEEDLDLADYDTRNVNMGDLSERRGSSNPLQAMFDLASQDPKRK